MCGYKIVVYISITCCYENKTLIDSGLRKGGTNSGDTTSTTQYPMSLTNMS